MTGPVIHQIVFDNQQGLRPVACSTDERNAVDRWSYWLERFNRLESYDDVAPPRAALSYILMGTDEAAVLYRWRDADTSPGRNPSHALVGPPDVLTVPVALGLARWPDWRDVPRSGRLPVLSPDGMTEFARQGEDDCRAWARRNPEPVLRVVTALLERPDLPISVIGATPEASVPLMGALYAIGKPYVANYGSSHNLIRNWTFSTYEHDHRASVSGLPEVVFLPATPRAQGEHRRSVVDLDSRLPATASPPARADAEMMYNAFVVGKEPVAAVASGRRGVGASVDARTGEHPSDVSAAHGDVMPRDQVQRSDVASREPATRDSVRAAGAAGGQQGRPAGGYADDRTGGDWTGARPGETWSASRRRDSVIGPPHGPQSSVEPLSGSHPGRDTPGGSSWSPSGRKEADTVQRLLSATDGERFTLILDTLGPELTTAEGRRRLRTALDCEVVEDLAVVLQTRVSPNERQGLVRSLLRAALGNDLDDLKRPEGQDFVCNLLEDDFLPPSFCRVLLREVRPWMRDSAALRLAATNRLLTSEGLDPLERSPEQRQKIRKGSLLSRPLGGRAQRMLWISLMALAGLALLLAFGLGYAFGSPATPVAPANGIISSTLAPEPAVVAPPAPGGGPAAPQPTPGTTGVGPGSGTGADGATGSAPGSGGTAVDPDARTGADGAAGPNRESSTRTQVG